MDDQRALHDANEALYPPFVVPPPQPLGLLRFLSSFVRNPLSTMPQEIYEQPLMVNPVRAAGLVWIAEPSLVEQVLKGARDGFPKSELDRRVLAPLLGNGLLTAEGEEWRWLRQVVAPLFRHAEMLRFVPHMTKAADDTLGIWRRGSGWRRWIGRGNIGRSFVVPIDEAMTLATFQVISRTMLHGGEEQMGTSIMRLSEDFLEPVSWPIAYSLLGLPTWFPYPGKRRVRWAQTQIRSKVADLIKYRRKGLEAQDEEGQSQILSDDLLARLLLARNPQSGAKMSDTQLLDTLLTFLMAGHETTAKALTWALYLLARSPQWQERLFSEITQITGGGPVLSEHIDQLTEVTKVMKEAMRLYPPVPVLTRIVKHDSDLGGHQFKAGTLVIIPIYAIHRHRNLWQDPNRFDPDRFSPAAEKSYPRMQFMPFGGGPRVCVGATFAMIEMVSLLATFVQGAKFTVSPAHNPLPIARVTLRPQGGMPLKVTLR